MELKRERKWLKMIQDWHKYEDSMKVSTENRTSWGFGYP